MQSDAASVGASEGEHVPPDPHPRRSFREPALWLLIVCVVLVYFTRVGDVTVRHEETRRGRIASEMIETGDWIVPRQQGEPFLSRPPLHNWAMAAAATVRGRMDAAAIRIPSLLAVLCTVVVIYLYSRRFFEPLGAFTAGAAYATMAQVLELGSRGETEAFFTLWITSSLVIWHANASRGTVSLRAWVAAYVLVAFGVLTKGLQAPIYFGGAVAVYMLLRGRWRELLRPAHFAGLLVCGGIVALWLVPSVAKIIGSCLLFPVNGHLVLRPLLRLTHSYLSTQIDSPPACA